MDGMGMALQDITVDFPQFGTSICFASASDEGCCGGSKGTRTPSAIRFARVRVSSNKKKLHLLKMQTEQVPNNILPNLVGFPADESHGIESLKYHQTKTIPSYTYRDERTHVITTNPCNNPI